MEHASLKPPGWRRWLGIGLRALHLAGVTLLGAALLGAAVDLRLAATLALASGVVLLAIECADGRIVLRELAGVVALAKLAVVTWMVLRPDHAPALFWLLLVVSVLSSHAPRAVRHWRPR
jgi:hypothetical protein